jgi:hypothetical protein
MGMPLLDEAQSILRRNRAVLAASAAAAIVIGGSCYAVYRVQGVLEGMQKNNETTSSLYHVPDAEWQPAR